MNHELKVRRIIVAVAASVAAHFASAPVLAQIIVTPPAGGVYPDPSLNIGPGNADLGSKSLSVSSVNGGVGSLSVAGGSVLRLGGTLTFGDGGSGVGTGIVSGAGSRIDLYGDQVRLDVGAWGTGSLTLSQGAILDARAVATACVGVGHYCGSGVGGYAGANGLFTLTGGGTTASFLRSFIVASANVSNPLVDGYTQGTQGATAQGRVEVLDGATLRTEFVQLTTAPGGNGALGSERSFADVVIRGAGSTWLVEQRSLDNLPALFNTGNGPNSWATITIADGGKLRIEGSQTRVNQFSVNAINLTNGLGRTDLTVTGAGSRLEMAGSNPTFNIGTSLGTANMQVLAGAVVDGPFYTAVGVDGSRGQLTLDGASTRFSIYGLGLAGTNSAGFAPGMHIGSNGTGVVSLTNGARLEINSTGATVNQNPFLVLARLAGSSGTLNISGANSVVSLAATSVRPGGGTGEALNPVVLVGRDGSGTLNISAGGKLLVNGGAISTVAVARPTSFTIGGFSDTLTGGSGVAKVSGAGSELRLTGSDTIVIVGLGPSASGQLNLSSGALLTSTLMSTARSGSVGVVNVDNAQVNLSGQFSSGSLSGAALFVGDGTGSSGVFNLSNGAHLNISNLAGTGETGVSLGGSLVRSGGSGIFNLSSGSSLQVLAGANQATFSVGRTGTGIATIKGSSVDLGAGSIYIGRASGASGTMTIAENSTVNAGYVGVGRTQTGDGGTGTLVVNGSTLTATTIEIGANGYLGGNGTIVGNIVNYGIVNPGNSPGTLTIDGSFINGLGGRLNLEIESDGHGGFNTDHLIFKNGSTVNMAGLGVRFRFLGNTDPNAFKASGLFGINQFFQGQDSLGQPVNLAPAVFAGASFGAQADGYTLSNFAFTVNGGASFTAAPVPEPGEWMMLLAGLGLIGATAARRAARRA